MFIQTIGTEAKNIYFTCLRRFCLLVEAYLNKDTEAPFPSRSLPRPALTPTLTGSSRNSPYSLRNSLGNSLRTADLEKQLKKQPGKKDWLLQWNSFTA